jgi:hypothetical protein
MDSIFDHMVLKFFALNNVHSIQVGISSGPEDHARDQDIPKQAFHSRGQATLPQDAFHRENTPKVSATIALFC